MTALLKPVDPALSRGLVRGMEMSLYQAHPALSRSRLDKIRKSPAHFKWSLEHDEPDNEAFRTGRLVHSAILEPKSFWPSVRVWDGGRRQGKKWDDFQAENAGYTIITADDEAELMHIADSVARRPIARMLRGQIETSLFWQCPATGIDLKCRPDVIGEDGNLYDVKTTIDASPEAFQRSAYKYGYHRQAAWYCDGAEIVTGVKPSDFVLVVVEKAPPYEVQTYVMDREMIERGRQENREALALYVKCREEGRWPGYDDTPRLLTLPYWAMGDDE